MSDRQPAQRKPGHDQQEAAWLAAHHAATEKARRTYEFHQTEEVRELLAEPGRIKSLEIAIDAGESMDERMLKICTIDNRFWGWSSRQWADLLDVADAAIQKSRTWREERKKHYQSQWTTEAQREYGIHEAKALIQIGTRWVQFFDLLSLWFCCRERTETEAFEMPAGEMVHFTPLKSGEVAVEPYPFAVPELTLQLEAKRMD